VVDKKSLKPALTLVAASFMTPVLSTPWPGVPTRDQNPLLQAYFIPAMPAQSTRDWTFSHSLYITNTFQRDNGANEQLLIDVENKRYDFQASIRRHDWLFSINLSLLDNNKGFLDQTIEGWHDIFGLPQGGRDTAVNNRLDLFYQRNGVAAINSQQADSGLGDVQLALGKPVANGHWWLAIELPSSDSNPLFSNDGIDIAAWYSGSTHWQHNTTFYGMAGFVFPSDNGVFKGQLHDHYLIGQLGFVYRYDADWHFFVQADMHSAIVSGSELDALGHSLQGQFGLRLPSIMKTYQLDLYFSEDIFPGHAPDITFSLRFSPI